MVKFYFTHKALNWKGGGGAIGSPLKSWEKWSIGNILGQFFHQNQSS